MFENLKRDSQDGRHTRAVIRTQARVWVGGPNHVSSLDRFRANADWHRVHMGGQHPARRTRGTTQLEDEISRVAGNWRAAMSRIGLDRRCRRSRFAELIGDKFGNLPFVAALPWNRH